MGITGDVFRQAITSVLVIFLVIAIIVSIFLALYKFGFFTWVAKKIIGGIIGG